MDNWSKPGFCVQKDWLSGSIQEDLNHREIDEKNCDYVMDLYQNCLF